MQLSTAAVLPFMEAILVLKFLAGMMACGDTYAGNADTYGGNGARQVHFLGLRVPGTERARITQLRCPAKSKKFPVQSAPEVWVSCYEWCLLLTQDITLPGATASFYSEGYQVAISLRARYAMSRTGLAHTPTSSAAVSAYDMPGTDGAYRGTNRCGTALVLTGTCAESTGTIPPSTVLRTRFALVAYEDTQLP
eukprot:2155313-Rhodomonas_salina.1